MSAFLELALSKNKDGDCEQVSKNKQSFYFADLSLYASKLNLKKFCAKISNETKGLGLDPEVEKATQFNLSKCSAKKSTKSTLSICKDASEEALYEQDFYGDTASGHLAR